MAQMVDVRALSDGQLEGEIIRIQNELAELRLQLDVYAQEHQYRLSLDRVRQVIEPLSERDKQLIPDVIVRVNAVALNGAQPPISPEKRRRWWFNRDG